MALKLFSALFVLIGIGLILRSNAQEDPEVYLKPHNVARAKVGLKPLTWDPEIAEYARKGASVHINDCELEHAFGPYSENLAGGSGPMTGTDASNMWIGEGDYYDPKNDSCSAPDGECGHYTNVVDPEITRMGCAKINCSNGGLIFQCDYQ